MANVAQLAEAELLANLDISAGHRASSVFILGAPRSGSTIFYQALCNRYGLPFIANLTNEYFADTPIIGLAVQKSVPVTIAFTSRYGKTDGAFQPSEGSSVMARWFSGGHPSALVSTRIIDGEESHFLNTLAAAEALFQAPLVIKNAWNCFRVCYLAKALPRARFIWIRRGIAAAAKSDLSARYKTKGCDTVWNSATPANVDELRKLQPTAQVVENQHEFSKAIRQGLTDSADGRWCQVWYEDFCINPVDVLDQLGVFLGTSAKASGVATTVDPGVTCRLPDGEEDAIDAYIAANVDRFSVNLYSLAEKAR